MTDEIGKKKKETQLWPSWDGVVPGNVMSLSASAMLSHESSVRVRVTVSQSVAGTRTAWYQATSIVAHLFKKT